jgi:predicted homoserine dehydrogenase-like protein
MTITTKTTITKTNGANGEVVIVEKKEVIAGERLNGNAGELLLYSIAI